MKELDLKNFDKFYSQELKQRLIKLEAERKQIILKAAFQVICFVIVLIILIVVNLFLTNDATNPNYIVLHNAIGFVFILTIVLLVFYVWVGCLKILNFNNYIKKNLYKVLFKIIDCNYIEDYRQKEQYKVTIKEIFKIKGVISSKLPITVCVDDVITGIYKSLPYSMIDTSIKSDLNDKGFLFEGIVLMLKINKTLKSDIIIKSKNILSLFNNQKVKLENVMFSKEFEVYSESQAEAKYILSQSFMDGLLKYKERTGKSIDIYMFNNTMQDANVFLFIPTGKDNFELNLFKSINNKNVVFNILKELVDALDVVNELQIEQNIG